MTKDGIYKDKIENVGDFTFNESVANAFDDMVSRSVPIYNEVHRITLDLAKRRLPQEGRVLDLGCSTGTTIALLHNSLRESHSWVHYTGVDNSKAMIRKCHEKLDQNEVENFKLIQKSLDEFNFEQYDFIIMNYTLQFIDPTKRKNILHKIKQSLKPGGVFLLSEKVVSQSKLIDSFLVDLYYDFKRRNHYSELEISQKREALENVLKPLSPNEQLIQLEQAGFAHRELIFKWYNFASYLCLKN